MSELKAHRIVGLDEQCASVDNDYYLKSEADKVIERIIKGAMSMFRESNRCRGLDTKSPLGRIADVAFKHWMYVERMEARITENDKEIAELKEFIKNYRFDNINMLHKIMRQDAELRHHKYKRCLAMAQRCMSMMIFNSKYGTDKKWHHFKKWHKRWLALAEEPTWEKFLQLIRKEAK